MPMGSVLEAVAWIQASMQEPVRRMYEPDEETSGFIWWFQELGALFRSPSNGDHSILGSIFGHPVYGNSHRFEVWAPNLGPWLPRALVPLGPW